MKILNLRNYKNSLPTNTVKLDKGTSWGNPFIMTHEGTDPNDIGSRAYVCAMFKKYALWRLENEPLWLKPLEGKDLACWCHPKQCHAEILIELSNYPKCKMCNGNGEYFAHKYVDVNGFPTNNYNIASVVAVKVKCCICEGRGILIK
jgi:hypothetical protein